MRKSPKMTPREIEDRIANIVRGYRAADPILALCGWGTLLAVSVTITFLSLIFLRQI
jgi:hypothetical protein